MEIKTVPSINTKAFHKLSICYYATRDVMRNGNVDLVHVHAVGPSVFSIFPRLKGIPTVVQTHGLEWKRDKWGFIGKTFFKLSDYSVVFFPTRLPRYPKSRKSIMKNGSDAKSFIFPMESVPWKELLPGGFWKTG
jgi:hypothetical protein